MGFDAGIPIDTPANSSSKWTPWAADGTTVPPRPCVSVWPEAVDLVTFFKSQNTCHAVKSPISIGNGPSPAVACHMETGVFVQHSDTSRQLAGTHFLVQDPKVYARKQWRRCQGHWVLNSLRSVGLVRTKKVRPWRCVFHSRSGSTLQRGSHQLGCTRIRDTCLTVCGDYLAHDDFRNGLALRILEFLTLEVGTDRLYRNASKELPLYSA
jgi:hypothetical protein